MDYRAHYARGCWGKYSQGSRNIVSTNVSKTTAGRPDRPALEEDTLAQKKSDVKAQNSKL